LAIRTPIAPMPSRFRIHPGRRARPRASGNAHRGPRTLGLADPARPDVTQFVVTSSVVSVVLHVVLMVSLQDSGWLI
jgi:hypothetical protein